MDKITKKALRKRLIIPFVVVLLGVLAIIIGVFLPYMTAVGELAENIGKYPDTIIYEDLNLTASDMKDIPLISVSKLVASVYGKDDGTLANVIVLVLGGFLALTALFTFLKKPIAVMIFGLFACGTFALLNFLMKGDFIGSDKYAWDIGYYAIPFAFAVVFAGALWMLVKKISGKKELQSETPVQHEE